MFKDLTAVCAECRLGYSNNKPHFDIHKETRIIKNPLNLKDMNVVNAHYHVTPVCVRKRTRLSLLIN